MTEYTYTFKEPKTKAEFILLLKEATRIGIELNCQLDEMTRILENEYDSCTEAA